MSSFANKHVLITGGGGGLGLLIGIQALKAQASKLIVWDVDQDRLDNIKHKSPQYRNRILTFRTDISDPSQIYRTAKQVLNKISHIDILINNAGIVTGKRFTEHSVDEIEQTISVNQLGMMHTTRAFLPLMIERQTGHIVNIASAAGLMANPGMAVYSSSKWGSIGWSESLRLEMAQDQTGVRVTTVEPSYINTGLFKGVSPPLLTPMLEAENIADRIIEAVRKNKIHLRAPFMVKLLPFLKGILPTKIFDFIAGRLFRVYHSMDTFEGRNPNDK